ncbi:sulfurtransferase complex subunit TusC [Catenovulum maritimum]|uniref:Uncharacterized protein n=1 Tax=Catenovulum maritimum TaxID=1513271 RepID=A0A0J8GMC1_9ALTE|nr:sulfurtransferase complex subunit TusC [Catenovulum maritimum]KMT63925.1 hypothetical protein XM47_16990 [Catenovulum maritimum]
MTEKSHAIILTQSPFQNDQGKEALELALTLATFEQAVSLYFKDAAVLQLIKNLNGEGINRKTYTDGFKALDLYDIENVFVLTTSLDSYNLAPEALNIPVISLTEQEWRESLVNTNTVLTF